MVWDKNGVNDANADAAASDERLRRAPNHGTQDHFDGSAYFPAIDDIVFASSLEFLGSLNRLAQEREYRSEIANSTRNSVVGQNTEAQQLSSLAADT